MYALSVILEVPIEEIIGRDSIVDNMIQNEQKE
jgi:hypothetical protein